jgi:hypothetical protein
MKASKLIALMKSLDAVEFKRLRLFLGSPFYNHDRHVADLYEYLAGHYPAFRSPRLRKETAYPCLFPEQPFDLNRMRKLMSSLTGLVEKYLSVLEFERDSFRQKKLLAGAYGRRNLTGFYEKETRALAAGLEASPDRGRAHYHEQLDLKLELFFHAGTDKHKSGRELLEAAMGHLDCFYLLTKLQLAAEMRTRENILAEKYSIPLMEEVLRESRQSFAQQNPLVEMYLHLIELHQDPACAVSPGPAIALFTTLLPTINRREQQNILHHLINHCVRLINRGVTRHRQELFELYRLGIENDLLIENNRITEIAFSNIVAVGASLQAFDWTRGFIDRYAGFLKEETREDVKALSLALWYFNHKLYGLAEHALLGHGFSDLLNLLKSRCLLIRTYF